MNELNLVGLGEYSDDELAEELRNRGYIIVL